MEENLNKNILTVLIIEIVSMLLNISLFKNGSLGMFLILANFIINLIAIKFLIQYKTKHYKLLSLVALIIGLAPIGFILYALSTIQC